MTRRTDFFEKFLGLGLEVNRVVGYIDADFELVSYFVRGEAPSEIPP